MLNVYKEDESNMKQRQKYTSMKNGRMKEEKQNVRRKDGK
jgi:hypothetical protein